MNLSFQANFHYLLKKKKKEILFQDVVKYKNFGLNYLMPLTLEAVCRLLGCQTQDSLKARVQNQYKTFPST